MSNVKLSEKEASSLLVNLVCNKLFILAPLYFKQTSGFSALIITTLVFLITIILWNIHCKFCPSPFSDKTNFKPVKCIALIIFITICTLITAVTIQQYSIEIKSAVLNNTPIGLLVLVFLSVMILSIKIGLKAIATSGVLFVPAIFIIGITLVIFSVTRHDLYNMFPVFDTNYNSVLGEFPLMLSMLLELVFLFFLPDILQNKADMQKTGNRVILRSFVYYLVINVVFSITLPKTGVANHTPFFRIIKQAHIGDIIIRLDSVFLILYSIAAFIYVSSMLLLLLRLINISYQKSLKIFLKAMIIITIVLISLIPTINEFVFNLISKYYYTLPFIAVAFPIINLVSNRVPQCKLKK